MLRWLQMEVNFCGNGARSQLLPLFQHGKGFGGIFVYVLILHRKLHLRVYLVEEILSMTSVSGMVLMAF
jgi:hypothetical protein